MKKIFIFLFYFLGLTIASAQVQPKVDNSVMSSFSKTDELRKALSANNSRQVTGFDNRYEGLQGSPFMFDDWLEGTLTLHDSAVVRDRMYYKFDLSNNTIWLKLGTGEERILYNKDLLALELRANNGAKYLIRKVKLPDITEKNHFSIFLFENEHFTLVKDVKKVFRKANLEDKGIVTVGRAYDTFEEEVKYYIKVNGKSYFEEINLKKSKLMALIPKSHEKKLEQFCDKNDIGNKLKDAEAIKLLAFITELKEN
jgi:hypothetical protein